MKQLITVAFATAALTAWMGCALPVETKVQAETTESAPDYLGEPTHKEPVMEKATFAAGCFWGIEAAFRQVSGVQSTKVGYTGGITPNPSYQQVCTGQTGHAEAVEIIFDPEQVSYGALLEVFWAIHDPTQLNRQGPDVGTQYRSAIFYHNADQQEVAMASKDDLGMSGKHRRPIVTEITPAQPFYLAEEYHQRYLEKRGLASCGI